MSVERDKTNSSVNKHPPLFPLYEEPTGGICVKIRLKSLRGERFWLSSIRKKLIMVFSVDIISDSYIQVEDLFPWIFRNSLNLIHPISNPALSFMINQAGTVKAKMYSVMAEDSPGLVAGP